MSKNFKIKVALFFLLLLTGLLRGIDTSISVHLMVIDILSNLGIVVLMVVNLISYLRDRDKGEVLFQISSGLYYGLIALSFFMGFADMTRIMATPGVFSEMRSVGIWFLLLFVSPKN